MSSARGAALAAAIVMRLAIALVLLGTSCTSLDGDDDSGKGDAATGKVGRWGRVTNLEIVAAHAHLLPTGEIMYWDRGNTGGGVTKTTPWGPPRIWDVKTDAITTVPRLDYEPFCSGHSFLPDGRLFVAGGHDGNDAVGQDRASIFDPTTRSWSIIPTRMSGGRWYPSTSVLTNGDILVLSGSAFVNDSGLVWNDLPQVYVSSRNAWRDLDAARFGAGGGIDPRLVWFYPFTHLAPDGRVFMAGPARETGYLDLAGDGQWSMAAGAARPFSARSSEEFRDYGSTVMYDAGKVMIVGGSPVPGGGGDAAPVASADIIDLNAANPQWQAAAPMAHARRMHTATVLPDGTVLVTGGTSGRGFNDAGGAVMEPELWNPDTNTWTELAPMSVRRIYHSIALLLPDARVVVAGGGLPTGSGVPDTDHADAQIFEPPYLFRGPRPEVARAPDEIEHGSTFTVETPDAARIAKVTLIRLGSVTHAYNHNQRAVALAFTRDKGALQVTMPANRNLAPAGHYMLFLVDDKGVPSVAPIVRVTTAMCDVAVTVRGIGFTSPGQDVAITGDLPELGQWNGRFGTVLAGTNFPTWSGTVRVPRGEAFEWKPVIVDGATRAVQFETGANRVARTLDAGSCPAALDVTWR